jgi:hypothetical protein
MSWPSHGPRGRHDWGTYLERGIEVVKVLLKAGAHPNIVSHTGRGALHEAAMHGHASVVKVLLQAGAHVEATMPGSRIRSFPVFTSGYIEVEGVTPLMLRPREAICTWYACSWTWGRMSTVRIPARLPL